MGLLCDFGKYHENLSLLGLADSLWGCSSYERIMAWLLWNSSILCSK